MGTLYVKNHDKLQFKGPYSKKRIGSPSHNWKVNTYVYVLQ